MKQTKKRGRQKGCAPGPGRNALPPESRRVRLAATVAPETLRTVRDKARRCKKTLGRALDSLIESLKRS